MRRKRLAGAAAIGRRVGEQVNCYKVCNYFAIQITADRLVFERNPDSIAAEARLDGLYAIRTSLPELAAEAAVEAYKSLSGVERAFRTSKEHLRIRPIHVYSENHVRGHVFLCMLAYHVEWHMRRWLAPILFQDDDPAAARARSKAATKTTAEGWPAHSFQTLLGDLATLALNQVVLPTEHQTAIAVSTQPTPLQRQAFDLLGVDPKQTVPITATG